MAFLESYSQCMIIDQWMVAASGKILVNK